MSEGFSAEWLALRAPHDRAAVDRGLVARLAAWAPPGLHAVDLGAGTGATFRRLSPLLGPGQRWTLVELDPALIAAGSAGLPANASYRRLDLAHELEAVATLQPDLITASALIDLVSSSWLAELATIVRRLDCALHVALTYDGRIAWTPPHPLDAGLRALVNRHQRTDKGFGPALGPDAAAELARLLPGAELARSDWQLGPEDARIQEELMAGYAAAALSLAPGERRAIEGWERVRLTEIRAGRSSLTIGHLDLLRLPACA